MKASEITVSENTTLKEALASLDRVALGIVFVVGNTPAVHIGPA
ncbi:hypothetical protein [Leptospira ellisii]|nr:hypothetical protein [Leptospira ellisii]